MALWFSDRVMSNSNSLPVINRNSIDIEPLEEALNSHDAPGRKCDSNTDFYQRHLMIRESLEDAGLGHAIDFHDIYGHMTFAVLHELEDEEESNKKYKMPDMVAKNMPSFGEMLHSQYRHYVDHAKGDNQAPGRIKPMWRHHFYDPQLIAASPAIRVLNGVRNHIFSRDLAYSMVSVDTPDEYYDDFNQINKPIAKVVYERFEEFLPDEQKLPEITPDLIISWIMKGREKAWRNSRRIVEMQRNQQNVEPFLRKLDKSVLFKNRLVTKLGDKAIAYALQPRPKVPEDFILPPQLFDEDMPPSGPLPEK